MREDMLLRWTAGRPYYGPGYLDHGYCDWLRLDLAISVTLPPIKPRSVSWAERHLCFLPVVHRVIEQHLGCIADMCFPSWISRVADDIMGRAPDLVTKRQDLCGFIEEIASRHLSADNQASPPWRKR